MESNPKASISEILDSIKRSKATFPLRFESNIMNIVSWNINSLRTAKSEPSFREFLSKTKPEVLCFQETKVMMSSFSKYKSDFPEYPFQYWGFPDTRKAGVAVLSKGEALSVKQGFHNLQNSVGRVISVEFEHIWLCNSYCPVFRTFQNAETWHLTLRSNLTEISKTKPVVWVGDFNIVAENVDYQQGRSFFSGCSEQEMQVMQGHFDGGFIDSYRYFHPEKVKFTWRSFRMNGNPFLIPIRSRVDYGLVWNTLSNCLQKASIYDKVLNVSDHCPIGLGFDFCGLNYKN